VPYLLVLKTFNIAIIDIGTTMDTIAIARFGSNPMT